MSRRRRSLSVTSHRDGRGEEPNCYHQKKIRKLDQCVQLPAKVTISDLPDEMILKILSYSSFADVIEVCQYVCQRWKRLCHDPTVWCNKEFRIDGSLSDDEVKIFLEQWPQIREMSIWRQVKESAMDAVFKCKYLKTLVIGPSQNMSCQLLTKFISNCPQIQSLNVADDLVDDDCKTSILAKLQRLKTLYITSYSLKKNLIRLGPFADGAPNLTRLHVIGGQICTESLEYFMRVKCKELTHLTFALDSKEIRCLIPLLKECSSLLYLHLLLFDEIGFEAFATFGQLSNLRSLLICCWKECQLGAAALLFKSNGLSKLLFLVINLRNLENDTVIALSMGCPQLKVLSLTHCHQITDEALTHIHLLKDLETLVLGYCYGFRGNALQYVAELPKLRDLCINGFDLSELKPGLDCVLTITSLETLEFDDTINEDCFDLERIPGKLINLRFLDLTFTGFKRSVVENLKHQMPNLKVWEPSYNNIANFLQ